MISADVLGLLSLDRRLPVFYIPLDDGVGLLFCLDWLLEEVLVLKLMMVLILMTLAIVPPDILVCVLLLRVLRAQMQSGRVVPDGVL